MKYYVPIEANAEVQTYLFSKTEQFKELLRPRRIIVTILLVMVWGLVNLYFRIPLLFILSTLLLIVLVALYQKFLPRIIYSNIRRDLLASIKRQLKGKEYNGYVDFSFEENGILLEGGEVVLKEDYENLSHLTEELDFLMIYKLDKINAFSIPLSQFETTEDLDAFVAKLTDKITTATQTTLLEKEEA